MIERHTLKNGIRVLAQKRPDSFLTSVLVSVRTGSRNETKDISGMSHFLEHMAFKGTKKRPSAMAISKEVDSIGASWNASTSREITDYQMRVDSIHFENSLDILNDIVFHSSLSEEEIKKEKGTIIEEINMYEDDPSILVYDFFDNIIYQNMQMARNVIGTKETVTSVDHNKMKLYRATQYRAGNVVVSLVGNLPKNYLDLINKYFLSVKQGETVYKEALLNPSSKEKVYLEKRETEQAHVILGVEAFAKNDKDKYALDVLSTLLGGYTSSRLWSEIRVKRGLAYDIHSLMNRDFDSGYLMAKAGLSTEKAEEGIKIIREEFLKVSGTLSSEEVVRAKDNIRGRLALQEESSMAVATLMGDTEIIGEEVLTLDQKIKKYEAVTKKDVERVANEFIRQENMKLAVIGPFKDEEKFVKILER